MNSSSVATISNHSVPAESSLVHIIERASRDPSVDLDKLERLIALQERAIARQSEEDFNIAMSSAQSEMRTIGVDSVNPQTRSKYASYAALDRVLRPIYTKHGISLSFNTEPGAATDCVRVVCIVSRGGFSRSYQVDMPADGKGAKGGDVMTKTHAVGAAMTYGARYLLKMIFNVAVGEHDDDGNGATPQGPIDTEQREKLFAKIAEVGADIGRFCTKYKIENVADLPSGKFDDAMTALAKFAQQKDKTNG